MCNMGMAAFAISRSFSLSAEPRTTRCGLLRQGVEDSLRKSGKHHLDQPWYGLDDSLPFCLWDLVPPHRGGAHPGNWRVTRSPATLHIPAFPPPTRVSPRLHLPPAPLRFLGMQDTAKSHRPSSDKYCTAMATTKLHRSLSAEVLQTRRRPRPDAVSAAPAIEPL